MPVSGTNDECCTLCVHARGMYLLSLPLLSSMGGGGGRATQVAKAWTVFHSTIATLVITVEQADFAFGYVNQSLTSLLQTCRKFPWKTLLSPNFGRVSWLSANGL